MSTKIKLTLETKDSTSEKEFIVNRMFNYGSAVKDPEFVRKHHAEVNKLGIVLPNRGVLPRMYHLSDWTLTTADEITVQGNETSGEAELVFLDDGGEILVGVGSDHTDRKLEKFSIHYGKQVCQNVLAPKVWLLREIEDHLDQVVMECETETAGVKALYQRVNVDVFMEPRKLMGLVYERTSVPHGSGVVLFSGTVPTIDNALYYADKWTIRLTDTVLNRMIEHTYAVKRLNEEVQEEHNLPLFLSDW